MTLEEAIKHCEEVAELNEHIATTFPEDGPADIEKCAACADEHRQLAEWLKELQRLQRLDHSAVISIHEKWLDFCYLEKDEDYHITVYRNDQFCKRVDLSAPMSREEFEEWAHKWNG